MSDSKTSILVNRQVPEYIREEYPVFISFLGAYYEYLETKQGTQINDSTKRSKEIRDISDVDESMDDFETNFYNTYAHLLPNDVAVDKEFLIKTVLPLYLAKGNEKSFKLLFRMIFNDEIAINLPKNNILRPSDGKWTIDNILKIETDVRSVYTANGNNTTSIVTGNTTFILAQEVGFENLSVYVDDVLKTHATDYYVRKESRKVIFNTAPAINSVVKVVYANFDVTSLNNRKITGSSSGATAIIEVGTPRIITDGLVAGLPFELFINNKTLNGSFLNGETITSDIIDSNDIKINLVADTSSTLTKINVINGGSSYNVGDVVSIIGGGPSSIATAIVESISAGTINILTIKYGGAGFNIASIITSTGIAPLLTTGAVDGVDSTGNTVPNFYSVSSDIISTYANTVLNVADYGFPSAISENTNTRIVDALTTLNVTSIGAMSNAIVLFSNVTSNITSFDSEGAIYPAGANFYDIKAFKSVARIDVTTGGLGYKIGDEIVFGSNPAQTYGFGAAAAVKTVAANGAITMVQIQPGRLTGTANIGNNSISVIGTGTSFTSDLIVGDKIVIRSQERYVNAITSVTTANVNVAFTFTDASANSNNCPIGSFSQSILGGVNYTQNNFPSLTISSANANATGAVVTITSLIGDGEQLQANTSGIAGQILTIKFTSGGAGYLFIPSVDITAYGSGTATANVEIGSSYATSAGRWTTSDSILSSSERKLQGKNYYVDYSYVTSSVTEFRKYKKLLKDLLHPAGFINYADLNKTANLSTSVSVSTVKTRAVSGTVNTTASSIYVTGTNTKFNIANTLTILTVGSNIAVNGIIRTVNSIISNTNISVSAAFTTNSNTQTLIVIT